MVHTQNNVFVVPHTSKTDISAHVTLTVYLLVTMHIQKMGYTEPNCGYPFVSIFFFYEKKKVIVTSYPPTHPLTIPTKAGSVKLKTMQFAADSLTTPDALILTQPHWKKKQKKTEVLSKPRM